ncbi:FkbM family methyltransferase [Polynucleobacter sp. P1-05-14]|uniref:FkbM family methyltransferase n=1 Tax=Polynucleobacter sp. P1-05-14 TaxID=1819732 RepID=UPI001C0E0E26|nr:FkbM family methyltransferase [Polynucleobacter sp. P1-05-14]MBU3548017.1 FkbM family methyltransferase [Polynucleobacter sp. P1-05-14]
MSLLLDFVREGDLFVDVGSNVGSYSILACAAKKARGFVFEPVPETYIKLNENIRLNHIENLVHTFNIGLSDTIGELSFTTSMDCMNHALSDGEIDSEAITVKVSTLDLILKDESPAIIKIDVEGFETPVLQGSEYILSKPSLKVIIIELNGSGCRYKYDENQIVKFLKTKGFDTYSYDPFSRKFLCLNGKNSESGNTIFIRDINFVIDRVNSSPLKIINGISY